LPDKETIGNTLRQLRGDLPRDTVAKACGISTSALAMYENGQRIPRDEIKMKLAKFYGKPINIFFAMESHEP